MQHPYLTDLHLPEDEPTAQPVSLFDFEYETQALTVTDLRDLVFEEILLHHFRDKKEQHEIDKAEYLKYRCSYTS